VIAGKNRAGKSSMIGAMDAAFGGAREIANDPVHHGAEQARIAIDLAGGETAGGLTIKRVIEPDGATALEVRDADGAIRRPQERLDHLIGTRFIDPLRFLTLDPKEQRARLMKIIPDAARIGELDAKRERAFDKRTEIGRKLEHARGELERLPDVDVGTPIDVAALVAEQRAFAEQQRAGDGLGNVVAQAEAKLRAAEEQANKTSERIAALERELDETRKMLGSWERAVTGHAEQLAHAREQLSGAAATWSASSARRVELEQEIARADGHNRAVFSAEAQRARRQETAAAVEKHRAEVDEITAQLKIIDDRKAEVLSKAKLPVEGLAIGKDEIMLAGVPLSQASASERWRVAFAMAIAGAPKLDDIWIRDGAVLDDDALELVAKLAEAAGKRCWIERVGTRDPGAIIIRDGQVES